ncbi:HD domain-containing protein [Chitinophaga terrae (ex Kim and Jung 2007)]|uniref:HD domain-containing protein n=1 Tax=Chitinophaga terrae (ex Kim and Jung 2007) TaxID=408074 RepID=A0A1H3YCY6_9BACT|nr:Pycsar system effector family protein [Chitinophaga terrae (ex Kim and Jung 2007)]MDQ0107911.1 putative metal-dependent HD superfamily phosphohydrolase [Chitinophaga terrae (ex Kim and Jung 2007)]SEA08788.1 HD domain-containing protein [Chitinophaga terrae (ex Kim and Jung 2007)]
MQNSAIIDAARDFIVAQYSQHPSPQLVYHNLAHTQQVVQAAGQIAAHYRLQDDELLAVYIAAWFHDIGYLTGDGTNHEETGAREAVQFLKEHQVPENVQTMVQGAILATKMPQSPNNLVEQIVCDADLSHLGSKNFSDRNKLLRHEVELTRQQEIPSTKWLSSTITFMLNQHYWTDYAQTLYKQQKEENIEKLTKKLDKKTAEESKAALENSITVAGTGEAGEPAPHEKHKKDKEKNKKPDRGIETMFRITSTNHIRLSSMADSKAHIMISVNSIIISVILSVLVRRLEDYPNMVIPSIIFLTTAVLTVIFSVLATRPNVTSGMFTKADIEKKNANLLFFGNFYKMHLEEYEWGMKQMMTDADFLYSSLTKDVYHLGVVLGHKYKLLRISYNIFMFGLIISVLAFLIAAIFFPVKV